MWHAQKWQWLLLALVMVKCADAQSSPAATPVPSYPNTSTGLEHLMADMLSLQKSGDSAGLAPYLQSLLLPDSERWFTARFGDALVANSNQVQTIAWDREWRLRTTHWQEFFPPRSH
jgi:hypothetical protein